MEASLPPALENLILVQIRSKYAGQRTGGIAMIVTMGAIAAFAYFALSGNEQNLWGLAACC